VSNKVTNEQCPQGWIDFEVVKGPEGCCLCVTKDASKGSHRLVGPKPWGGGKVIYTFRVAVEELAKEMSK